MDLEDFDNGTAYAHYRSFGVGLFSVDPEEDGYPLTVADYSGTAGRAPGSSRDGEGQGWPPSLPAWRMTEVLPGQGLGSRLHTSTSKSALVLIAARGS